MMRMKKLPKKILVYPLHVADGLTLYAITTNINAIPEDVEGKKVGFYTLDREHVFRVRRELK